MLLNYNMMQSCNLRNIYLTKKTNQPCLRRKIINAKTTLGRSYCTFNNFGEKYKLL